MTPDQLDTPIIPPYQLEWPQVVPQFLAHFDRFPKVCTHIRPLNHELNNGLTFYSGRLEKSNQGAVNATTTIVLTNSSGVTGTKQILYVRHRYACQISSVQLFTEALWESRADSLPSINYQSTHLAIVKSGFCNSISDDGALAQILDVNLRLISSTLLSATAILDF